jgi:hypothetical protein
MDVAPGLAVFIIIIVIVAIVVGFEVGQWWAEFRRGSFEAQIAWRRRKLYRTQRKKRKPASGNAHDSHN